MTTEPLNPFPERAEAMLARVFGGMHHVYSLKKEAGYWTCIFFGDVASFDGAVLTRLVLGAHEYCLRVSISNGGPHKAKIWVHDRSKREGAMHKRHPTIEQAIEYWNQSK